MCISLTATCGVCAENVARFSYICFQSPHQGDESSPVFAKIATRIRVAGENVNEIAEFGLPFAEFLLQSCEPCRLYAIRAWYVALDNHGRPSDVRQEVRERVIARHDPALARNEREEVAIVDGLAACCLVEGGCGRFAELPPTQQFSMIRSTPLVCLILSPVLRRLWRIDESPEHLGALCEGFELRVHPAYLIAEARPLRPKPFATPRDALSLVAGGAPKGGGRSKFCHDAPPLPQCTAPDGVRKRLSIRSWRYLCTTTAIAVHNSVDIEDDPVDNSVRSSVRWRNRPKLRPQRDWKRPHGA
jgi:hypothetical protein